MLQVPCLSPPVYGHSHYKKFWLRQTEVKESLGGAGGVSCEMVKSSSTSSPEAASSSKRIFGKRRPAAAAAQVRDVERIEVPVNECASPASSGEIPPTSGLKRSCYSRKNKRGSDGSSTVSSLEGASAAAAGSSPKSFLTMSIEASECQALQESKEGQQLVPQQPQMLVRHNMSSNESPIASLSSEQTAVASLDCLTSKCKSADSLLLRADSEDENSDSDSATSSTSQASDNDDARCRTSFHSLPKRRDLTPKAKDEKVSSGGGLSSIASSPKTRHAAASASAAASPVERASGHGSSPGGMNNVSRTCKHCGTMKTPLWRNGPLGPKSLCNACGIRLRKARRSNAGHEGGQPSTTATTPGKRKQGESGGAASLLGLPYKKSRVAIKREHGSGGGDGFINAKLNLLGKSLSTDEEEGAVLLMALSCGLVLA